MAKEELIEMEGTVTDGAARFYLTGLSWKTDISCLHTQAARCANFRIRVVAGDKVKV